MAAVTASGSSPDAAGPVMPRDWVIDVHRVAAMFIVVLLHWLYLRLTVVDGSLVLEQALHGPVAWGLSWVLQVLPVFFLAGGFANTVVLDRTRAAGQEYGAFLGLRARRLLTPLVPLIGVALVLGAVVPVISVSATGDIGEVFGNPLWFLGVYLLCVTCTGVAVSAHDRLGWWLLPTLLLGGSLLVDALRFGEVIPLGAARWSNLALVWLFCHQLGVLHARGVLSRRPPWTVFAVIVLGVAALVVMVVPGPYFPTSVGMADASVSNLMPPTSAMSVLAVVQLGLVTLVGAALRGWQPGSGARRRLRRLNAMLIVIYLWHVPAMAVATVLGLLAPQLLLPADEQTWWLLRPLWFLLAGAVLWIFVRSAMAWESYWQQFLARDVSGPVLLGAALGTVGTTTLWRVGIGWTPAALAASALVLLAVTLLTTAQRRTVPGPAARSVAGTPDVALGTESASA